MSSREPSAETAEPGVLLPEDLELIDSDVGWMILTTLLPDGQPHSVPMGYLRLDQEIYMGCRDGTQKVRNVERDPRVTLLLSTPRDRAPHRGLMLHGEADVVRDPVRLEPVFRIGAAKRGQPDAPLPPGITYIRVRPTSAIRWTIESRRG